MSDSLAQDNEQYEVDLYDKIRQNRNNEYTKHKKYGITPDEYEAILEAQNGMCAACGKPEQSIFRGQARKLAIDHCHTSGFVRGLLCGNCNRALGLLYEDPERITALLRYVEERCNQTYNVKEILDIATRLKPLMIQPGATDNLF